MKIKKVQPADEINRKEIGKRIRAERCRCGMSQKELGRKVGVEQSFFSVLERGEVGVSLEVLVKICKEVGVGMDEMVFGTSGCPWSSRPES